MTVLLGRTHSAAGSTHDDASDPEGTEPDRRGLWRDRVFVGILAGAALLELAFVQLFSTYPLTMQSVFGHSEAVIGLLMATNTVLIVAFEMVIVHRFGGSRVLGTVAAGCLLLVGGFVLVPQHPSLGLAFLAVVIITFGEMLTVPFIEGAIANRVPEASIGRAMGAYNATFATTFVLGPVIGTWAFDAYGFLWLWIGGGGVLAIAGLVFWQVGRLAGKPST